MDPLTLAALGIGILQTGAGFFQEAKADKLAEKNLFPERTKAKGITDSLALSENMASQGLTDSAKQAYIQNSDRALTTSLEAILRSGTGGNAIGDAYDNYNQGITRLSLAEDEARVRNFTTYMKNSMIDANEDDLNWQVNQYAPWANKAQQAARLSQQGSQNKNAGINTAFGAIASGVNAKNNPSAGLFSNSSTTSTPQKPVTTLLAPNPREVNYSDRSLQLLNSLGMRPLSADYSVLRPELNNSVTGGNNFPLSYDQNNPSLTVNWPR